VTTCSSSAVGDNWLTTGVTRSLYGFDEKSPDIETRTDRVGGIQARYRARTLSATGFQINNAQIRLDTAKPTAFTTSSNDNP
jgi:hypothetical protein